MKIEMKKFAAAAVMGAVVYSTGAMAAQVSESFDVTLELINTCEISTAPQPVEFKGSATLASYTATKFASLGVTCGANLAYTVDAKDISNPSSPKLIGTDPAEEVPYTLAVLNSVGTEVGNGLGNGQEQLWRVVVDLDESTDATDFTSTTFRSEVEVTVAF